MRCDYCGTKLTEDNKTEESETTCDFCFEFFEGDLNSYESQEQ